MDRALRPEAVNPLQRHLPPLTGGHLLGTDGFGIDVASRIMVGAQTTVAVGVIAVGIAALVGVPLGILAALVGMPFYSEASGGYEVVVGATGGYVLGFIPAAYLIGLAARHGADRNVAKALLLFLAGQAVVFAVGVLFKTPQSALDTARMRAAEAEAGEERPLDMREGAST